MECPHCKYTPSREYDLDGSELDDHFCNPFFKVSNGIIATRKPYVWDEDRVEEREILGCPECDTIFLGGPKQ